MAGGLLICAGICGVLVWIWALADGALYQHTQESAFARQAELSPAAPVLADPGGKRADRPPSARLDPQLLGKLEAPSVGLAVMVREGVDDATLRRAAGHLPSSAMPGESGNLVLLGHRDTHFRPLRSIARGDAILMRTRRGSFRYAVESVVVVSPDQAEVLSRMAGPAATLITCYPFGYAGPAPRRLVVQARLEEAAPVEAGD
jgi:sortase A